MTTISLIETILSVGLAGIAGLVLMRLLDGRINVSGLLIASTGEARVEPERVQALAAAVAVPALYAIFGIADLKDGVLQMPDVPDLMLAAAAGSQAIYLGGKIARRAGL